MSESQGAYGANASRASDNCDAVEEVVELLRFAMAREVNLEVSGLPPEDLERFSLASSGRAARGLESLRFLTECLAVVLMREPPENARELGLRLVAVMEGLWRDFDGWTELREEARHHLGISGGGERVSPGPR